MYVCARVWTFPGGTQDGSILIIQGQGVSVTAGPAAGSRAAPSMGERAAVWIDSAIGNTQRAT